MAAVFTSPRTLWRHTAGLRRVGSLLTLTLLVACGQPLALGENVSGQTAAASAAAVPGSEAGQLLGVQAHAQAQANANNNATTVSPQPPTLTAGDSLSCYIDASGRIWCWGSFDRDTDTEFGTTHAQQQGTDQDWVAVATGYDHEACGLRSNNEIWCWSPQTRTVSARGPQQVPGSYRALTIGPRRGGLAIGTDGSLWSWDRPWGQSTIEAPVQLGTDTNWTQVARGTSHTCGVKADHTLWCWGRKSDLGITASSELELPAELDDLPNNIPADAPLKIEVPNTAWASVAAGYRSTCALTTEGALWCWGASSQSLAPTHYAPQPIAHPTGGTFASMSLHRAHLCAVDQASALWCVGSNSSAQIQRNAASRLASLVQVYPQDAFASVAAGDDHTCAVRQADQTVTCWGGNRDGQLGNGIALAQPQPHQVVGDVAWKSLRITTDTACGITQANQVACWDAPYGYGLRTPSSAPYPIGWLSSQSEKPVTMLVGDRSEVHVLTDDGLVRAWSAREVAAEAPNAAPTIKAELNGHYLYPMGWRLFDETGTACGIALDGTVWCRAYLESEGIWSQVGADNDWVSLATGDDHACGIRNDGTLWCWGANTAGQLGDGTFVYSNNPVQVGTSNGWTHIRGQQNTTCGLNNGALLCWGDGRRGDVGNGDNGIYNLPIAIGPSDATWVDLDLPIYGYGAACAVQSNGTLWCWGDNDQGQAGQPTPVAVPVPTQVGTDNNWHQVSVSAHHSCGVRQDNTAWCWGSRNASLGITPPGGDVVFGNPTSANNNN